MHRLLAAADSHGSARTIALLTLLAHTGLRIGKALSRDVEHLTHDHGHRILRLERKGGRGDRTVLTAPVSPPSTPTSAAAARARCSSPTRASA
jgi:integrase